MVTGPMTYGDLSPRNGVYHYKQMLKRAVPMMFLERTAKKIPVPRNAGKQVSSRRYNRLAIPSAPISEGVVPRANKITYDDYYAALEQWGDYIEITDVVNDTHEDPIMSEFRSIQSQQMAETKEDVDWKTVIGGTAVYYANGSARTDVNTPPAAGDFKLIERALLANYAQYYTSILEGKPKDGTVPVAASFLACGHTDLKADLEGITGFTKVEEYATPGSRLHQYEVGSLGNVRFVLSPLFVPFYDGGGASAGSGTTMVSTSGTSADVYPIVVMTQLFWACTPLRGVNSGRILVVNPKATPSQPLGQKGSLGWMIYRGGMIIDDTLGARLECAATATPT